MTITSKSNIKWKVQQQGEKCEELLAMGLIYEAWNSLLIKNKSFNIHTAETKHSMVSHKI